MDDSELDAMDTRLRQVERDYAALQVLMARNTEIVDDIRKALNKPEPKANIPSWIAAIVTASFAFGGLLYTAFIAPLEDRVTHIEVEHRAMRNK